MGEYVRCPEAAIPRLNSMWDWEEALVVQKRRCLTLMPACAQHLVAATSRRILRFAGGSGKILGLFSRTSARVATVGTLQDLGVPGLKSF